MKSFLLKSAFQQHQKRAHQPQENHFVCNLCTISFSTIYSYRAHKLKKHQILLNCNECEKKFEKQSSLNEHMKTHAEEKPHACSFCELKFSLKIHMDAHILSSHSVVIDYYNHYNYYPENVYHPDPCSNCNRIVVLKSLRDQIDKELESIQPCLTWCVS